MVAGSHFLCGLRAVVLSGCNRQGADADGAGAERLSTDGGCFLCRRFRPVYSANLPDAGRGGADG
ncbi:hypothetical protein D3C85_1696910 [compost metagenome]